MEPEFKHCKYCDALFKSHHRLQQYCCEEHWKLNQKEKRRTIFKVKQCISCSLLFKPLHSRQQICKICKNM